MNTNKYIFNPKLAAYLMWNGCKLIRLNHHLDDSHKMVFVFKDSEKVANLMVEYNKLKEK